jgi:hypothetical protein
MPVSACSTASPYRQAADNPGKYAAVGRPDCAQRNSLRTHGPSGSRPAPSRVPPLTRRGRNAVHLPGLRSQRGQAADWPRLAWPGLVYRLASAAEPVLIRPGSTGAPGKRLSPGFSYWALAREAFKTKLSHANVMVGDFRRVAEAGARVSSCSAARAREISNRPVIRMMPDASRSKPGLPLRLLQPAGAPLEPRASRSSARGGAPRGPSARDRETCS